MTRHRIPASLRLLLAVLLLLLSSGSLAPRARANNYFTPNPTMLDFGNQAVGTTSTIRTIVLTNTLAGTGNLGIPSADGDFSVSTPTSTCTNAAVPSGGTCTVDVLFTPQGAGTRTGTISVPNIFDLLFGTAPLTGTGIAAVSYTHLTLPTKRIV